MKLNPFFSKISKKLDTSRRSLKDSPPIGGVDFGDFARLKPIGDDWGLQRGGPIDRYYIENFLAENAKDVKGHALEIMNAAYLQRFGGQQVTRQDILDIDSNNPLATIIADLSKADHLPSDTYDCIILTQTLHLIYDLQSALKHLHRILKKEGVLLLTVPGISHYPYKTPRCWAFTEKSVRLLLEEQFISSKINITKHGNVLVTAAFLYGLGRGELSKAEYDYKDPNYQLIITARAVK